MCGVGGPSFLFLYMGSSAEMARSQERCAEEMGCIIKRTQEVDVQSVSIAKEHLKCNERCVTVQYC